MRAKHIPLNPFFIGRTHELGILSTIQTSKEASIVVVYGRRRVGKTELLEQAFRERNILKFEGIEGASAHQQIRHVLAQLAEYAENPIIKKLKCATWVEVFQLIAEYIRQGSWTLYFEEVQWLANYQSRFVTELKYVWDNYFRHNPELILILCGSAPSFITQHILRSRALYNRSQYEIPLKEFNLSEARLFLKKRSDREIMDAYLTVGGIPEYLKRLNQDSSVFLSLCKHAFTTGGFFAHEYERVFTSSLARNKNYKKIVNHLSRRRFATRTEILSHLKSPSGGTVSVLLQDLEACGFISRYSPYNLKENSLLTRYAIGDPYLQFYFKFIEPIQKNIEHGDFNHSPTHAISIDTYHKWLGFSFERLCRRCHRLFAKILGFEAVVYRVGPFFNRRTKQEDPGYQIDLLFDRADKVYTLCEIKYLQTKVGTPVITEFEKKIALFPNPKQRTLHKVLIAPLGADETLINRGYFDRIITLADMLDPKYYD